MKTKATNISASDDTVGVINEEGKLKIAGSNLHGRLGLEKINVTIKISLNQVTIGQDVVVKQVCCGQLHTLALSQDGQVFSWGGSYRGKQGEKKQVKELPKPMLIEALKDLKISQIGVGRYFSAALDQVKGNLYTWGCGENGQLGHGTLQDVEKPKRVKALEKVEMFQCGWEHVLAVTQNNKLFSWGLASIGRLGLGDKIHGP